MTREGKTFLLLILTYVLYATSIFLSQGAFIFPFPLNGFALFVITLQLAWWNKDYTLNALAVALVGLSSLIGSPPFWEIWLNNESLLLFEESGFYTMMFQIHSILIIVYLILATRSSKDPMLIGVSFITAVGIIIGMLLASYLVFSLSFSIIGVSYLLKNNLKGLNWIWAFLAFFNLINFISLEL